MRAAIVAILAIVAVLALTAVDASTVRIYTKSTTCGGIASYRFITKSTCWKYNDTTSIASGQMKYAKIPYCNTTTGKFNQVNYGTSSTCTTAVQNLNNLNLNTCLSFITGQSYKVYCSAGSVAFAAVAFVVAVLALLL